MRERFRFSGKGIRGRSWGLNRHKMSQTQATSASLVNSRTIAGKFGLRWFQRMVFPDELTSKVDVQAGRLRHIVSHGEIRRLKLGGAEDGREGLSGFAFENSIWLSGS